MDQKIEFVNSLILRIAEGEKRALDMLYEQFSGLFFIMAKKYLFDKSKAEDVVGEVLLRLVKSARSFKRGFNGLNWLFKSIRNEAIDTNRRDGRHSAENIDDYPDIRDVMNFDEKIINNISLDQALKSLNGLERKALYFKFWEGLTVREIGKAIKLPRSTAQGIISGALKKLEDFLNDSGQNHFF